MGRFRPVPAQAGHFKRINATPSDLPFMSTGFAINPLPPQFGSRVAGPRALRSRRSRIAPCSTLDFPLLHADCSALRIVCPVLATDFTRRLALDALRRSQIALLPPPCVRAGRGSPRVTDRSVLSTWNSAPPTDCSAYDTLRFTPLSDCSSLAVSRFAPLADCSVPDAWPSMPVYGSLRTLTLCARVLIRGFLRVQH